jgi:uroporphyrinogen decarboxylase
VNLADELLNRTRPIPVPILTYPGADLSGHSIRELVTDTAAHVDAVRALIGKYKLDIVFTAMDLSPEAEAFGAEVRFADDDVPTVTKPALGPTDDPASLPVPEVGDGRTWHYIEVAGSLKRIEGPMAVLGGQIGPLSLAGRLMGVSELLVSSVIEPDRVFALVESASRFVEGYMRAFRDAGADGVFLAEPVAGLVSPLDAQRFSYDYVGKIVERVQTDDFMVLLHNCGQTRNQVGGMLETGAACIHLGPTADVLDVLADFPQDRLLMGNLDPVSVFRNGTPAQVASAVEELLDATKGAKNFVISSGCDIPPGTPHDNIAAFLDAARSL